MFRIFISYRRGDTRDVAQRMFERISKQFWKSVFCDVDGVKIGDNFSESLLKAAETCDVMLVVIGPEWFGKNSDGSRRIDDPNDWVFREVNIALERNIPVVPVLIYPARQPMEEDLPLSLKELAFRESITVYNDKQFESSVRTVVDHLVVMQERKASRLGLMSPGDPLKSYRLQTAPPTRDAPSDFQGPRRLIESEDNLSLLWEVPNPETGFVYSIVLEW